MLISDGSNASDFVQDLENSGIGVTAVNYSDLLNISPHFMGFSIYDVTVTGSVS